VKNEYLEYPVIKLAVDNQITESVGISEKIAQPFARMVDDDLFHPPPCTFPG
jgi:hypothetical protein